jgi:hypothetical protein
MIPVYEVTRVFGCDITTDYADFTDCRVFLTGLKTVSQISS